MIIFLISIGYKFNSLKFSLLFIVRVRSLFLLDCYLLALAKNKSHSTNACLFPHKAFSPLLCLRSAFYAINTLGTFSVLFYTYLMIFKLTYKSN